MKISRFRRKRLVRRLGFATLLLISSCWLIYWSSLIAWGASVAEGTVLGGNTVIGLDTLVNARVELTLVGNGPFFTTTDLAPAARWVTYADASGDWYKWVPGVDSLFSIGDETPTYTVSITHSDLVTPVVYTGLPVLATVATDTTQLRDIIAGM